MLKITGLDKFTKRLEKLAKAAKEIDGEHSVPVNDLLTPDFVAANTKYIDAAALFAASGFKIETSEDFAAIPDAEWDDFIRSSTKFQSWQEMLSSATAEWTRRKLGF